MEKRESKKLPHTEEEYLVRRGTCTTNFARIYICKVCAHERIEEIENSMVHVWDNGIYMDATETECAYTVYTCLYCDESYIEEHHKLPEDIEEIYNELANSPTKSCSSFFQSYCINCNKPLEFSLSNWDDGVILIEPTEDEIGLRKYSCLDCDKIRYEAVLPYKAIGD